MKHTIKASAWRVVLLMCGVLVLSGAARASRVNAVTVGAANANPGNSRQFFDASKFDHHRVH